MERVSSGTILLAFIAILCGLLGVYALRTALRPKPEVAAAPIRPTVVPMASRDLSPGHRVTLGDVALVRMSRAQMKEKGISGVFMSSPEQIIGRTLKMGIDRGATFDTEDFFPDGVGPGIADKLHEGERAVTVAIAGSDALIGFAGAGQIVDVLFKVGDFPGGSSSSSSYGGNRVRNHSSSDFVRRSQTHLSWSSRYGGYGGQNSSDDSYHGQAITLMQGVRVLAIENNAVATDAQKPVAKDDVAAVTLAVSPEQVEVLRVVQGYGEISLSLRNPKDTTTLDTIDVRTLEGVLGIQKAAGPRGMDVYRGQAMNRVFFSTPDRLLTRYSDDTIESMPVKANPRVGEVQSTGQSAL